MRETRDISIGRPDPDTEVAKRIRLIRQQLETRDLPQDKLLGLEEELRRLEGEDSDDKAE